MLATGLRSHQQFFLISFSALDKIEAAEMSDGNLTTTSYSYITLLLRFRHSFCDSTAFKIPVGKLDFDSTWQRE